MSSYSNALTEVYTILEYLNEEEFNKISPNVINAIENNRNKEYIYEMNEEVDLTKQKMLPETKAILYNLFRDYLATEEQREKILKWQQEEREKNEQKKRERYNVDVFVNSDKNDIPPKTKCTELIEYKESIFTIIKKWFKALFKRK